MTRTFTLDELDTLIAKATPGWPLAAFARELLTEREALRDRLARAWAEASKFTHGEDSPARLRENSNDPDGDTADEDGPVECDCGMDDLWRVLDVREVLPDMPPILRALLADAPATPERPRQTAAEFMAAHADDPGGLLAGAPERFRPTLEWRYDEAHGEHRLALPGMDEALGDAFEDSGGRAWWSWRDGDDTPADSRRAALTALRDAAVAAGFDVPEVPDV